MSTKRNSRSGYWGGLPGRSVRKLLGAALLGAGMLLATQHAAAVALQTEFVLQTEGQSMWGEGEALQLDLRRELLGVQWGNSRADPLRFDIGDIYEVETKDVKVPNPARAIWEVRNAACFNIGKKRICPLGNPGSKPAKTLTINGVDFGDYGAEIKGETFGDMGLEFRAHADSGSVDVELPVSVTLNLPDSSELEPGDTFTIESELLVSDTAALRTVFPEVDLGLYLTYDLYAEAAAEVCFSSCAGPASIIPTLDIQGETEIIGFNPADGISSAFEFSKEDDDDSGDGNKREKVKLTLAGEIEVKAPSIQTEGGLSGGKLTSSGEDDFLTASLDIDELARTAAGIPFPLGAEGLGVLGATVDYDILAVNAGGIFAATQDFSFDPQIMVSLDTGFGAPLAFKAGESIQVTIPDDVTAISFTPTYTVAANGTNFTNTTGLRVDPFSNVSALSVNLGVDLPGFVNALGFSDPNLSAGPLYSDEWRVTGPGLPVFQDEWALGGFNTVSTEGLDLVLSDARGSFAAELVTGSQVGLSQFVANPGEQFSLGFDYAFESGLGMLEVVLGDLLLVSLDAGGVTGFQSFAMDFDLSALLAPSALADFLAQGTLELAFLFDGPSGSTLLLDGIQFAGVVNGGFDSGDLSGWTALLPEGAGAVGTAARLNAQAPAPATLALLLLGLAAVCLSRRRPRVAAGWSASLAG